MTLTKRSAPPAAVQDAVRNHQLGIGTPGHEPPTGAWFIYGTDMNDYPIALFGDELTALRYVAAQGYHVYVKFWEWGEWER